MTDAGYVIAGWVLTAVVLGGLLASRAAPDGRAARRSRAATHAR